MKLLGSGWQHLLEDYFDHTVTFYEPTKAQDDTGELVDSFTQVEALTDVPCAVGNRQLIRSSTSMNSYGSEEQRTAILIADAHPEIKIGWKAVIDHLESEPYLVEERTPNQSADVSEIPVRRWH